MLSGLMPNAIAMTMKMMMTTMPPMPPERPLGIRKPPPPVPKGDPSRRAEPAAEPAAALPAPILDVRAPLPALPLHHLTLSFDACS